MSITGRRRWTGTESAQVKSTAQGVQWIQKGRQDQGEAEFPHSDVPSTAFNAIARKIQRIMTWDVVPPQWRRPSALKSKTEIFPSLPSQQPIPHPPSAAICVPESSMSDFKDLRLLMITRIGKRLPKRRKELPVGPSSANRDGSPDGASGSPSPAGRGRELDAIRASNARARPPYGGPSPHPPGS